MEKRVEKVTPAELAANLLNDSEKIDNAILIYETKDDYLHYYLIGRRTWAIGAMRQMDAQFIADTLEDEDAGPGTS
jgi:hypothetical protein